MRAPATKVYRAFLASTILIDLACSFRVLHATWVKWCRLEAIRCRSCSSSSVLTIFKFPFFALEPEPRSLDFIGVPLLVYPVVQDLFRRNPYLFVWLTGSLWAVTRFPDWCSPPALVTVRTGVAMIEAQVTASFSTIDSAQVSKIFDIIAGKHDQ